MRIIPVFRRAGVAVSVAAAAAVLVAATTAGGASASAQPTTAATVAAAASASQPGDDLPLASAVFKATHNSYSGNIGGARGSIANQLDQGTRFFEFDIHDNNYAALRDYIIGHEEPGDEVDRAGNPASNLLRDWLEVIATWSAAHPDHAPLMVMFDLKDDLTDNGSFAAGNMAALNKELADVFGSRLLRAKDVPGALGTVGSLRGRILTLLSGGSGNRAEYRRNVGHHPAVAINGRGQVVEVHESPTGGLWYWTGNYGSDGRVTWARHGRYDSGKTPAIALNDAGWLVEVHQSQNSQTLWHRVGRLDSNGEITWSESRKYDDGVLPTISFVDPAGNTLREIHRSGSNDQNWDWDATLNTTSSTVTWNAATHGKTSDPRFDVTVAANGTSRVSVWTGTDGAAPAQTLRYSTDRIAADRIRYQQVAFTEYQPGDPALLQAESLFYAAPATNAAFITAARGSGRVVRGWNFNSARLATDPLANYPATDYPAATWYAGVLTAAGAIRS